MIVNTKNSTIALYSIGGTALFLFSVIFGIQYTPVGHANSFATSSSPLAAAALADYPASPDSFRTPASNSVINLGSSLAVGTDSGFQASSSLAPNIAAKNTGASSSFSQTIFKD